MLPEPVAPPPVSRNPEPLVAAPTAAPRDARSPWLGKTYWLHGPPGAIGPGKSRPGADAPEHQDGYGVSLGLRIAPVGGGWRLARRIAIVIHQYEPIAGSFRHLQEAMVAFVTSLDVTQAFFVVFFGLTETPIPGACMMYATAANKARAATFIRSIRPSYGADPRAAIRRAAALRPTLLWILASSPMPDDLPEYLGHLDPQHAITVRGICFMDMAALPTIKELARRHGDAYMVVRPR